jgi:hypothetical protein
MGFSGDKSPIAGIEHGILNAQREVFCGAVGLTAACAGVCRVAAVAGHLCFPF